MIDLISLSGVRLSLHTGSGGQFFPQEWPFVDLGDDSERTISPFQVANVWTRSFTLRGSLFYLNRYIPLLNQALLLLCKGSVFVRQTFTHSQI